MNRFGQRRDSLLSLSSYYTPVESRRIDDLSTDCAHCESYTDHTTTNIQTTQYLPLTIEQSTSQQALILDVYIMTRNKLICWSKMTLKDESNQLLLVCPVMLFNSN